MTDIVERLRKSADNSQERGWLTHAVMDCEAADEIERLQSLLTDKEYLQTLAAFNWHEFWSEVIDADFKEAADEIERLEREVQEVVNYGTNAEAARIKAEAEIERLRDLADKAYDEGFRQGEAMTSVVNDEVRADNKRLRAAIRAIAQTIATTDPDLVAVPARLITAAAALEPKL